jgi:hypothetical protein
LAAGATKLLLSLGMTRFDIFGRDISSDTEFSLPPHIERLNANGILFFLAMRKHIGFPEGMRRLPFEYIVYEDHEGETLSDARRHTQRVADAWGLRVAGGTSYTTGESNLGRAVLLLHRA